MALIILNEKNIVKNIDNMMINRHNSVLEYICITSSASEFEQSESYQKIAQELACFI